MSRKSFLKPLEDRMTKHKSAKREQRIEARSTVARELFKQQTQTRQLMVGMYALLSRGFFGRFRWLLFGK